MAKSSFRSQAHKPSDRRLALGLLLFLAVLTAVVYVYGNPLA